MGWEFDHQVGSHIVMRNSVPPHRRLSIPDHKEVAKGTLHMILKRSGITSEELKEKM